MEKHLTPFFLSLCILIRGGKHQEIDVAVSNFLYRTGAKGHTLRLLTDEDLK